MSSGNEVLREVPSEAQGEPVPLKKVTLRSSDGVEFELEPSAAMQSGLIKETMEDGRAKNGPLRVPVDVTGQVLAKVVEYWKRHREGGRGSDQELDRWDAEFVNDLDMDSLLAVIAAVYHLKCKPLAVLTCQAFLERIEDFDDDEVLDQFGVELRYTAEEKQEFQDQNPWFFD